MSTSEIIAELPKLSRKDRRRLAAAIFDLEEEADLLRDCDRRADERFRTLDVMEEEAAFSGGAGGGRMGARMLNLCLCSAASIIGA